MHFVKTPYIPQGKTLFAVGDVKRDDITIIKPFYLDKLPHGLRYHADLSFCYLGDGIAVCAPESYDYYIKAFENTSLEIIKGEKYLDMHYPKDASYNVAIVGDKMFCKKDIADRVLLDKAEECGYEIININQGYAKCSVCPIDEKSAISADASFCKAAEKAGIDTLRITNETIQLRGYDNGFFGGCAYLCDKNTFCTKGDITTHPDYEKISLFLEKRNIKTEYTKTKDFLCDFGSFIPVCEE